MLREKHGVGGASLFTWSRVASVEETTGLFLSVLGYWKVSCESIPALECLGSPPAVVPSKARWAAGN